LQPFINNLVFCPLYRTLKRFLDPDIYHKSKIDYDKKRRYTYAAQKKKREEEKKRKKK
jgi:hypothetical protein